MCRLQQQIDLLEDTKAELPQQRFTPKASSFIRPERSAAVGGIDQLPTATHRYPPPPSKPRQVAAAPPHLPSRGLPPSRRSRQVPASGIARQHLGMRRNRNRALLRCTTTTTPPKDGHDIPKDGAVAHFTATRRTITKSWRAAAPTRRWGGREDGGAARARPILRGEDFSDA